MSRALRAACAPTLAVLLATAAAPAPAAAATCSWASQIGAGGAVGYDGDLDASYWVTSFLATPGAGLSLLGIYPSARYMSISAYNTLGAASGVSFYDAQIQPVVGTNPFQPGAPLGGAGIYQVQIDAGSAPPDPAPNTLYVGQNDALVYVMYRIYDAGSSADPTGGVGVPQVSTTFRGRVTSTSGACVASAASARAGAPDATALRAAGGAASGAAFTGAGGAAAPGAAVTAATPAPGAAVASPTWQVVYPTTLANSDASYLEAQVAPAAGRIVVVQAQMPTFPDTNAGAAPWAPAEVRYWSLCDEAKYSLEVTACVADYAAAASASGGVSTFVFSAPADRPTNATAANGVDWLPLGSASTELLVYRQLLAAPSFAESIAAVPPGDAPGATMGPFAPSILYCSPAQFESGGAAGCGAPGAR